MDKKNNGTQLEVNNIEVVYNDIVQVLRGVSLNVPEGKIVALLGTNGAGKTTTLRAISGLLSALGLRISSTSPSSIPLSGYIMSIIPIPKRLFSRLQSSR